MGALYFGDNLHVLREEIKDETIDLIYLDPPFNSKRDYNVFLKTPKGHESDAQITAFEDSWHWGEQAEREFSELLRQQNTDVAEMIQSLRRFLKESDMMAYLVMMANRLLELHRVLKPTGSLYLHCDPTASHYLKIVMDAIFGAENYANEIIWKRADTVKGNFGQGTKLFDKNTDTIFFYRKSENNTFNPQFKAYSKEYIDAFYKFIEPGTGRKYQLISMTGPGGAAKGNPYYEVMGVSRYWRYSKKKMEELIDKGLVIQTNPGAVPRRKQYLDEGKGVSIQTLWDDISALQASDAERLGYPTQKPLALLERIIEASSNKGDIVLDPFCGCGTAVHAAQKLGRDWIGIDITHLSISLIEKRMKDAFPGLEFPVHGTPKDLEGAQNLAERDKYQFQWWACSLVGAQPYQGKKKGADGGTDGIIFFQDDEQGAKKIIVSVKGGEHVNVSQIRDLKGTIEREKAAIGIFVTLNEPTEPMVKEAVTAGFYESPKGQVPKIQILSIEKLLNSQERPEYYDISSGSHNFKKAKKEGKKAKQEVLKGF
ncbi:MAG TPA: DNA methyltransferase [Acidobacteriota bacterium]|nr:DNA methyltransferase [Acidobacteriota bacterium]HNT17469.1 DNA methyltransferase [Acidobacteriota bacterium]HPA26175.1 DNA methyltransferase [Acidobacteriota bacterium]HQO18733.1 DNA methyltransferase [Acidobacteriota bacterium]HQQ46858.1 DNA methyltransferase [Acidobacteriota bacterium]